MALRFALALTRTSSLFKEPSAPLALERHLAWLEHDPPAHVVGAGVMIGAEDADAGEAAIQHAIGLQAGDDVVGAVAVLVRVEAAHHDLAIRLDHDRVQPFVAE